MTLLIAIWDWFLSLFRRDSTVGEPYDYDDQLSTYRGRGMDQYLREAWRQYMLDHFTKYRLKTFGTFRPIQPLRFKRKPL